MKIIPNHILAKAMDGSNLGIVNQGLLLLQMHAFRLCLQLFCKGKADPLPHFRRRRIGESYYQKLIHIYGRIPLTFCADQR